MGYPQKLPKLEKGGILFALAGLITMPAAYFISKIMSESPWREASVLGMAFTAITMLMGGIFCYSLGSDPRAYYAKGFKKNVKEVVMYWTCFALFCVPQGLWYAGWRYVVCSIPSAYLATMLFFIIRRYSKYTPDPVP